MLRVLCGRCKKVKEERRRRRDGDGTGRDVDEDDDGKRSAVVMETITQTSYNSIINNKTEGCCGSSVEGYVFERLINY